MKKVKDKNGKEIKFHDVVRDSFGEVLLVVEGSNKSKNGLGVSNNFIGANDWLDVYPDGELEVLGNVDFSYED